MTSRLSRAALLALATSLVTALFQPAHATIEPPIEVSCYACLVMDDTGKQLWGRNVDTPVAVASATKIVTALVVRDHAAPDEEVTVSGGAAATPGGKLSLVAGESFSVEELLYGLLMQSSNDAAVALAEHVGGTEAAFVDLMNELAAALGATSSHFVTAHGLDDPGHLSSALDLTLFAAALLDDPLLADAVGRSRHVIEGSARTVGLENTNVLLETYRGAVGVKTGFTGDARNVLVAAAERAGRRIITVAQGADDHFGDSRALLDYGFAVLRRTVLVEAATPVGTLLVAGGGGATAVTAQVVRGPELPATIGLELIPAGVPLPVGRGEPVGTVVVTSGDRIVAEMEALASGSIGTVEEPWGAGLLGAIVGAVARVLPGEG